MDLLFLDNPVGQGQQLGVEFEEFGPGLLGPLPGQRQLAYPGAVGRGNRIELVLARFAAREHPGGVELALGAAAGGLSTFTAQEVKTAGQQFGRGGHQTPKARRDAELAPELAAKGAGGCGHLYLYNTI